MEEEQPQLTEQVDISDEKMAAALRQEMGVHTNADLLSKLAAGQAQTDLLIRVDPNGAQIQWVSGDVDAFTLVGAFIGLTKTMHNIATSARRNEQSNSAPSPTPETL